MYLDANELDITNEVAVKRCFDIFEIAYCVNCAAYTAVDKAESEPENAEKVNVTGTKYLAKYCEIHKATLIHISTDFVFDGKKSSPYTEADAASPLGVYGITKLRGEVEVAKIRKHFVIRTSWLYSEFHQNFFNTMLRLGTEREELNVVYDQIGSPTYAGDLANVILKIIRSGSELYGLYHFSNEGVASWYDFAKAIFEESKVNIKLNPIKTEAYPTPAMRPNFSVFDKSKIKANIYKPIPYWRESLRKCIISSKYLK